MGTFGITQSACPECRALVPAKVLTEGDDVFFLKFCPEHGERKAFVRRGVKEWIESSRLARPAWEPLAFAGDASKPCPLHDHFLSIREDLRKMLERTSVHDLMSGLKEGETYLKR